jgi:hypothetical protein
MRRDQQRLNDILGKLRLTMRPFLREQVADILSIESSK